MKKRVIGIMFALVLIPGLFISSIIPKKESTATAVEGNTTYQISPAEDNPVSADPLQIEQGQYDNYTNRDFIEYKGEQYLIGEYEQELFDTKALWDVDLSGFVILDDDPIVNIIPRELFAHRGNYLYVGRNYGFFVHTSLPRQFEHHNENEFLDKGNLVDVIVFSITHKKLGEVKNNPDALSSELTILIRKQFRYLVKDNDGRFFGCASDYHYDIKYSPDYKKNSVVVSVFVADRYGGSVGFALKDLVFSKDLRNVNHPNKYYGFSGNMDSLYNPEDDMGNFITRMDYSFSGYSKPTAEADYVKFFKSALDFGMNFVPYISVVGPPVAAVYKIANKVYTTASSIFDWVDSYSYVPVAYESGLYSECKYTTREDQLDEYGELTKTGAIGIVTGGQTRFKDDLTYRQINDYAKADFTLSRGEKWQTVVINTVSVSVVEDRSGHVYPFGEPPNPIIISAVGSYLDDVYDKEEYKPLELNTRNEAFILPGYADHFVFEPQYSGCYDFKSTAQTVVEVKNGKTGAVINKNKDGTFWLEEGRTYKIDVSLKNTTAHGRFDFWVEFSPPLLNSDEVKNINLNPQEYSFLKFIPDESLPYTIKIANANLRIEILDRNLNYIYDSDLVRNRIFIGENGIISAVFTDENYYVKITNETSSQLSCNVKAIAPIELKLNQANNISLEYYADTYYSFTPELSGNYEFSSTGNNRLSLYNDDFIMLKNINENFLSYYLVEGKTYFFKLNRGFNNLSEQKIVFNPNKVYFGNNLVYNDSEYSFYEFVPSLSGNYKFFTDEINTRFSLYDSNLDLIKKDLSSAIQLEKNIKYYVLQEGVIFKDANLNILLETLNININLNQNYPIDFDGEYINLEFTPSANGNYIFNANNALEMSLYTSKLLFLESSSGQLKYGLLAGEKYYINIKNNPSGRTNFSIIFNPTMIELNSGQTVKENGKYYMYVAESNNPARIYTYGASSMKIEIIIYNSDFVEIGRSDGYGHANFQHKFNLGEKYFLQVNIIKGPELLGLVLEDLTIIKDCVVIEQEVEKRTEIKSNSTQTLKFSPDKTNNFEIIVKVDSGMNYFTFKLLDIRGNEIIMNKGENYREQGTDYIYVFSGLNFEKNTDYFIVITSDKDIFIYISLIIPMDDNAYIAYNGKKVTSELILAQTENVNVSHYFEIVTNNGATIMKPELRVLKDGSEYNGTAIFFPDNPLNGNYIELLITKNAVKGDKFTIIIFFGNKMFEVRIEIKYMYDLEAKTSNNNDANSLIYSVMKNDNLAVTSLPYFIGLDIEVKKGANTFKYTTIKLAYDLSDYIFDKDLIITGTLHFNQNGNMFDIPLSGLFYTSEWVVVTNLSEINSTNKKKIAVDLKGQSAAQNKTIKVPATVEALAICGDLGKTYIGISFTVLSRTGKLWLNFNDFKFTAPNSTTAITCSYSDLELNITGNCSITGGAGSSTTNSRGGIGGTGIYAKNLTIEGTGTLNINGGVGGNGQGTFLTTNSYGGIGSYSSSPGGEGGRGVECTNLIANINSLTITGGKGGNGSNVETLGTVASGGRGGYGIYCTSLKNDNSSKAIVVNGGNGGNGGKSTSRSGNPGEGEIAIIGTIISPANSVNKKNGDAGQ